MLLGYNAEDMRVVFLGVVPLYEFFNCIAELIKGVVVEILFSFLSLLYDLNC